MSDIETRFKCQECGRGWSGLAECHCVGGGPDEPGCHKHFLSVAGFDAHRKDLACLSTGELLKLGKNGKPRMYRVDRPNVEVWVTETAASKPMPQVAS